MSNSFVSLIITWFNLLFNYRLTRKFRLLRNHRVFVTQGVTQSYFTQTKSVVSVIQKHVTTLHIKLCDKTRNKASGCGAVGSALPWGSRVHKFKYWPAAPHPKSIIHLIAPFSYPLWCSLLAFPLATQTRIFCHAGCYAINFLDLFSAKNIP